MGGLGGVLQGVLGCLRGLEEVWTAFLGVVAGLGGVQGCPKGFRGALGLGFQPVA